MNSGASTKWLLFLRMQVRVAVSQAAAEISRFTVLFGFGPQKSFFEERQFHVSRYALAIRMVFSWTAWMLQETLCSDNMNLMSLSSML